MRFVVFENFISAYLHDNVIIYMRNASQKFKTDEILAAHALFDNLLSC